MANESAQSLIQNGEIDLYLLCRILWKKKLFISLCAIILTVTAISISFMLNPVYQISVPVKINPEIEKTNTIKSLIENGAMDNDILQKTFKGDKKAKLPVFEVSTKNEELILINLEHADIEQGKRILVDLVNSLEDKYSRKLSFVKQNKANEISSLMNKIKDLETDKKLTTEKTSAIDNKIKTIQTEQAQLKNLIKYNELQEKKIRNGAEKIQHKINSVTNNIKLIELSKKELLLQEEENRVDIESQRNKLNITKQTTTSLSNEIKNTQENTRSLNKSKLLTSSNASRNESLNMLVIANSIQQNLSLLNKMNDRKDNLLKTEENIKSNILKSQLKNQKLKNTMHKRNIEIDNNKSNKKLLMAELANNQISLDEIQLNQQELIQKIQLKGVDISNARLEQREIIINKEKYNTRIANLENTIKKLKNQYKLLSTIDELSSPFSSIYPVKPRKSLIAVLSMLLSIIFASLYVIIQHQRKTKAA